MFARVLEFIPKFDKRDELIRIVRNEIHPILKKQPGFVDVIPLIPEMRNEKVVSITLWTDKKDADRYEREVLPRVEQILQPFLTTPITWKVYTVETSLCEHFVNVLVA